MFLSILSPTILNVVRDPGGIGCAGPKKLSRSMDEASDGAEVVDDRGCSSDDTSGVSLLPDSEPSS